MNKIVSFTVIVKQSESLDERKISLSPPNVFIGGLVHGVTRLDSRQKRSGMTKFLSIC